MIHRSIAMAALAFLTVSPPALAGQGGHCPADRHEVSTAQAEAACPPGGKAAWGQPVWAAHRFSVVPWKFQPQDYPVTVQFRTTDATKVLATLQYNGPSDQPAATVPENMPVSLFVKTSQHDFMCYWGYWVLPQGAQTYATLPFGTK